MARARRQFANQDPFPWDSSPQYACDVTGDGRILHWMAFDPQYGPESEKQIEWHRRNGTPGAERWKIGVPCLAR